jgi:hypothetical protein
MFDCTNELCANKTSTQGDIESRTECCSVDGCNSVGSDLSGNENSTENSITEFQNDNNSTIINLQDQLLQPNSTAEIVKHTEQNSFSPITSTSTPITSTTSILDVIPFVDSFSLIDEKDSTIRTSATSTTSSTSSKTSNAHSVSTTEVIENAISNDTTTITELATTKTAITTTTSPNHTTILTTHSLQEVTLSSIITADSAGESSIKIDTISTTSDSNLMTTLISEIMERDVSTSALPSTFNSTKSFLETENTAPGAESSDLPETSTLSSSDGSSSTISHANKNLPENIAATNSIPTESSTIHTSLSFESTHFGITSQVEKPEKTNTTKNDSNKQASTKVDSSTLSDDSKITNSTKSIESVTQPGDQLTTPFEDRAAENPKLPLETTILTVTSTEKNLLHDKNQTFRTESLETSSILLNEESTSTTKSSLIDITTIGSSPNSATNHIKDRLGPITQESIILKSNAVDKKLSSSLGSSTLNETNEIEQNSKEIEIQTTSDSFLDKSTWSISEITPSITVSDRKSTAEEIQIRTKLYSSEAKIINTTTTTNLSVLSSISENRTNRTLGSKTTDAINNLSKTTNGKSTCEDIDSKRVEKLKKITEFVFVICPLLGGLFVLILLIAFVYFILRTRCKPRNIVDPDVLIPLA